MTKKKAESVTDGDTFITRMVVPLCWPLYSSSSKE